MPAASGYIREPMAHVGGTEGAIKSKRLHPTPSAANYLHLRALRAQIDAARRRHLSGRTRLRMLDLGCGDRPYEPLFRGHVETYIGVDYRAGPGVDVVAQAESLPFPDATFDCVICSQVLEHADDPAAVIRETSRVLRPCGVAFVSTHGVVNYHPNPDDFWRWTHTGLNRLLELNGHWSTVEVIPNGGTASALAYLGGRQAEVFAAKAGIAPLIRPAMLSLNITAWNLDRLYRRRYPRRPPDLSPSYLAIAVRQSP